MSAKELMNEKKTREREFHNKQQDADRILLLHVDKTANLSKIQIDMVHFFAANWSFFSHSTTLFYRKFEKCSAAYVLIPWQEGLWLFVVQSHHLELNI